MSEPIYINFSSSHVKILDQDLVDTSNIFTSTIEEVIENGDLFEESIQDSFETESYQGMLHDNESNVNLLNSDDNDFHHDSDVTIQNHPKGIYRSPEEEETVLHEFSRDQQFEITRGSGRRKYKFGVVRRVRLIFAKDAKCCIS